MKRLMHGAVLSYPDKFMRTISALSALTKCILAATKGAGRGLRGAGDRGALSGGTTGGTDPELPGGRVSMRVLTESVSATESSELSQKEKRPVKPRVFRAFAKWARLSEASFVRSLRSILATAQRAKARCEFFLAPNPSRFSRMDCALP